MTTPDSSSLKVAVVGYNFSSLMALRSLSKHYPHLELKWVMADHDLEHYYQPLWLCLPEQTLATFDWDSALSHPKPVELEMYWGRTEHEPLSSFVNSPYRLSTQHIPQSIRSKIESVTLWNDLTPHPWTYSTGIDYQWTHKQAQSFPQRKSEKFYLIPRKQFLDSQSPVAIDTKLRAMALDSGEDNYRHKLIYNAPFGSESFDRILWTSLNSRLRFENSKVSPQKEIHSPPIGKWKTWIAKVPENVASFLKPASIWLDRGLAGKTFVETGVLKSSCLYRVFRNPNSCETGFCYLQIEILEITNEPILIENGFRPDQFLWNYCPFLQNLDNQIWIKTPLDESWLYASPFPFVHSYAKGLDFWSGGPISHITRLIEAKGLWSGLPSLDKISEKSSSHKINPTP